MEYSKLQMIPVNHVEDLEKKGTLLEEKVVAYLQKNKYHICFAESCTGGLLAGAIVNVSGASDILNESYVTYSNEAKHRLVGVPQEILQQFGAVSFETAYEMAKGVAQTGHAQVGIGVTGIAGPTGGTNEKPVGLVYIGLSVLGKQYVAECHFQGSRLEVRQQSVKQALALLLQIVSNVQDQVITPAEDMVRYSIIEEKNKREIVLLRGKGCAWRKCTFCDYHLDFSLDEEANIKLNHSVLAQVTGQYGILEVINSGSFVDLPKETRKEIIAICVEKKIREVHFECHYMHRTQIPQLRKEFSKYGILVKVKLGVETFDKHLREDYLKKGIPQDNPSEICKDIDEICLLVGIKGQTADSIKQDIETGLKYVERVCVNVFVNNTTPIKADEDVVMEFVEKVMPIYKNDSRVDILMHNTDFGVG